MYILKHIIMSIVISALSYNQLIITQEELPTTIITPSAPGLIDVKESNLQQNSLSEKKDDSKEKNPSFESQPNSSKVNAETSLLKESSNLPSQDNNPTPPQEIKTQKPIEIPTENESIIKPTSSLEEQAAEQDPKMELESSTEEPIGIDTIDLKDPQGNWLFKRIWWERAQIRYEKIRALVDQIWEFRVRFFLSRSELDRTVLDPFYVFVGFGQGELQQILSDLISRIEQESTNQDHVLNTSEKELFFDIKAEKKSLEDLNNNLSVITTLDHSVDTALERLMEQINRVRTYERDAWNQFKEIGYVLNDAKARELYYKMDSSWRTIKDIYKYLQNDFANHFQELTTKISSEINNVKTILQELKNKGIDLKNNADAILHTPEKKSGFHDIASENKNSENDQEEPETSKGFFRSTLDSITNSFTWVKNTISSPFIFLYQKISGHPDKKLEEQ